MIKIDELKSPPIIGKYYLVPCLKYEDLAYFKVDGKWIKDEYYLEKVQDYTYTYYVPIINHPHSDKENGQPEVHYHIDERFTPKKYSILNVEYNPKRIIKHSNIEIEYVVLQCNTNYQSSITPVSFISKSKLKHDCVYKGKCPHRGYDLSQEIPDENGIITCPLHGLKLRVNA